MEWNVTSCFWPINITLSLPGKNLTVAVNSLAVLEKSLDLKFVSIFNIVKIKPTRELAKIPFPERNEHLFAAKGHSPFERFPVSSYEMGWWCMAPAI